MSIIKSLNPVAQTITNVLQTAAAFAVHAADPEWCELVFASFPNGLGEDVETVQIGAMPARAKVRGEVVRLYLHIDDPVSFAIMRDAIRVALEPFFVGGRQLAVHDIAEGFSLRHWLQSDGRK